MRTISKKIVILVELIKNINILNISIIISIVLSFFKINRYITFIFVMILGVALTTITQKIIIKYLGDNKSIFQSKFFIIFAIFLNIAFLLYYFFSKDYGMLISLSLFLFFYSLGRKIMNKKRKVREIMGTEI